jgi:hypothetical protein
MIGRSAQRTVAMARRSFLATARKPTWWLLVFLMVLLSFGLIRIAPMFLLAHAGVSPRSASALIVGNTFIATVLMVPAATFVFGLRIVRDRALGLNRLIVATGVSPAEQVLGHAIAASALITAALIAILLACIAAAELVPDPAADVTVDFSIARYLVPAFLMLWLPTFAAGSIAMAAAATVGRASAVVFCWLPIISISLISDWSPDWLPSWIDHGLVIADITGQRWFEAEFCRVNRGTDYFNATPVATLLSETSWYFTANRLMSAVAVVGGIVIAARANSLACRPRHPISPETAARAVAEAPRAATTVATSLAAIQVVPSRGSQAAMASALARSNALAVASRPGLWCWVVITALIALSITTEGDTGIVGEVAVASSGKVITQTHELYLTMTLVLTASAMLGLMDRRETPRREDIIESTAISNGAIAIGRMAACLVPTCLLLASVFPVIMAAHAIQGNTDPIAQSMRPWPVLLSWGVLILPSTLFFLTALMLASTLFRTTHTVVATAAGLVAMAVLPPLFRGAATPWWCDWAMFTAPAWSDIAPLQPDRSALLGNRAMVLALAVAMASMAIRTWPRVHLDPAASPSRAARLWRAAIAPTSSIPLAIAAVISINSWRGGFLGPEGPLMRAQSKAYIDDNLLTWARAPQPTLTGVDLGITLDPASDTFWATASLRVENRHAFALRSFAFTVSPLWRLESTTVSDGPSGLEILHTGRSTMLLEARDPLGDVALRPGEACTITFHYRGYCTGGIGTTPRQLNTFMVEGGVLMASNTLDFLPLVGFFPELIEGSVLRPDRCRAGAAGSPRGPLFGGGGLVDIAAEVRIPADYRANLPGTLVSESVVGGWRVLRWKTDRPVSDIFHIVAGRWIETKGQRCSVWHSAEHGQNVPSMVEALDAARESYSQWFGEYPWRELRLSEFPGLSDYAQSGDTNIVFSESMGFRALCTDDLDAAFTVTAHEAAHQWWGGLIVPGTGGNVLSEGLAQYATIRLVAQRRGMRMQQSFLRRLEEQYLATRDPSTEEPLSVFDDGSPDAHTLLYHRAGWVFWMLAQRMGYEASDAAHRQFVSEFADRRAFPVLGDYINCMRRHADPRMIDAFSAQWFDSPTVAHYNLKVLASIPHSNGWRTTVQVTDLGDTGDPVEVAITNGMPRWGAGDIEATGFRSETALVSFTDSNPAEITVETEFEPREAIIDPNVKILQVGRAAAVAKIVPREHE